MSQFSGWHKAKMTVGQKPQTLESEMQKSCVKWFRIAYDFFGPLLFSIPNGAKVGGILSKSGFPVMASILKGEGMTAGIPDLFLALPRGRFHGLFIEMKTPIGALSVEQRQYLEIFSRQGYAVALCRSSDEFEAVITAYIDLSFQQEAVWEYKRQPKKR